MKRKPKYLKILKAMDCCYGGNDERQCGDCPYDRYNDESYYGEGGASCMLKLNEDARKWIETVAFFTTCGDCVCFHRDRDENDEWRDPDEKTTDGYCSIWRCMMFATEYCSRGAVKDD